MRRGWTATVVLACGMLAAAQPSAQNPPAPTQVPGTFRSGVALVPLDVRVLDRDGRPVTDLGRDEFVVLEDRVPQRISHFSHQMLTAVATPAGTRLAMRQPPGGTLEAQKHRVFLLVLGRGRLQHPARGVDAAIAFVQERLLPQDQVAVLAYNRATDFTTDRASLIRVLERFRERHERIEADLKHRFSGLAAVYGSKMIPESMQEAIDDIFDSPAAPAFRRLPPGRIVDLEGLQEDARHAFQETDPLNRAGFDLFVSQNVQTLQDLGNVYAGIEYLRFIDGEKHLVFLSEDGLFVPRFENDRSLASVASDARVVIDTIKTGGVYGEPPGRRTLSEMAWRHNFAAMAMSNVARLTGGRSSLFRHATAAFQRVDEATRSFYLLGYYPSRAELDGRFRRIEVKVRRPAVTVLVRSGYFARPLLVPFDRRRFLTYSRVIAAGGYSAGVSDIKVALVASIARARGPSPEVVVDLRITPARVAFTDQAGVHTATLDVAVFCGNRAQDTTCEQWSKMDLTFDADGLARAKRDGVPYSLRIPVKEPPRYVKVIVYDYAADVLGSVSTRVR